jgi:hypothetical protein
MAGSKRKAGRPSIQTPEIIDEIMERLSAGEPLAQICRSEHMPGLSTVYDWVEADTEISGRFARARLAGFDVIATEALRIADTPCDGLTEELEPGEGGDMRVIKRKREDMLGHRKLQVETRLKLLAKWDPKRYGELLRQEHSGPGGTPLQFQKIERRIVDSAD